MLEVCIRIQLGCARTLMPRNHNLFLFDLFLFFLKCLVFVQLCLHIFKFLPLCFVLFVLISLMLFRVLDLFEYHEHTNEHEYALMQ